MNRLSTTASSNQKKAFQNHAQARSSLWDTSNRL